MATGNPFGVLGDDVEDPLELIAAQQQKMAETKKAQPPSAKFPSKPLPPAQALREAKSEPARGGRGGGRGYARERGAGGGSYRDSISYGNRDSNSYGNWDSNSYGNRDSNSYGNRDISGSRRGSDDAEDGKPFERRGGYGGSPGDHRGGFNNGDTREGEFDSPRKPFDRRSGPGHGSDTQWEDAGWGEQTDMTQVTEQAVIEGEMGQNLDTDKPSGEGDSEVTGHKEAPTSEVEEKPEDKEMTLDEYEKVLEEKRKSLQAFKTEGTQGRKVDVKEFETMQQISNKKTNDDIFAKLASDKDKKKELVEKEERTKKSISINEFLKPADGERYRSGGRGRGRGRGSRGGYGGAYETSSTRAPAIADPSQFPTLGGK